jgi:hypothetical protein
MKPSEFLRETVYLVRNIETQFIELAMRLSKIRGQHMWKSGGYESFDEYLESAKISKGNASKLISVYENYLLPGKLEPKQLDGASYTTLYEAIPLIEEHGVTKVVEMVRTLTRSEIQDEIREDKHGVCRHEETIHICASCRKRVNEV